MSDKIADWPRSNYSPGGGVATLFYVAYGPSPAAWDIPESYNVAGIPAGIELMAYGSEQNPETLRQFQTNYVWEDLYRTNPQLCRVIAAQSECVVFQGEVPDPQNLNYMRDVTGLICWLVDRGHVAVYDPHALRWWSASEWRESASEDALASHVAILSSPEVGGEWLHTRGMRKFGRPDLSIRTVPERYRAKIIDLLDRFIHLQISGGVIPDGREIRIPGLPPGMKCFNSGSFDDPDFNNVHIEIFWPTPRP